MMKIMKKALRKCWPSCHHDSPGRVPGGTTVPGFRAMNRCTAGMFRKPLAAATATMSTTKPTGNSHNRFNHLSRPIRTRGGTPSAAGRAPAHVSGSMTFSPRDRRARYASTAAGVLTPACAEREPSWVIEDPQVGSRSASRLPPARFDLGDGSLSLRRRC
jgi:hypothetical protein